jgi:hypothetical protein
MKKGRRRRPRQAAGAPTRRQVVAVIAVAKKEGRSFLSPAQYLHVTDLVKQLTGFGVRQFESNLRIEPLGDFWELKDKGGVLRRLNVRVYFAHVDQRNEIVVLSTYKKEDDGPAPAHIIYRLKNRLRLYLDGELTEGVTYFRYDEPDERS